MSDAATDGLERVATTDGALLTLRRKPSPDGSPVIFLHGLAGNADLWDLPPIDGPGFRFRSLAQLLHEAGHDVWLVNLRGHGAPTMLSTPAPRQTDWCVDHFIALDLPAVCDHVLRVTGRRPFVIGSSMGAMTLAGYVQGALLSGGDDAPRVAVDPALARQRQSGLAGAIFAEFPAALRWARSAYDNAGKLRWSALVRDLWRADGDANYPFEILARLRWLEALLAAAGTVSLQWLKPDPLTPPLLDSLPPPLLELYRRIETRVWQSGLDVSGKLTGHSNHRAEVILRGRRLALDDMKAGVLRQMRRSVMARAFVSGLGEPAHAYSDHYHLTTLPTLVLSGGRDRIAGADVTRAAFFDAIAAADKTMLSFPDLGHGEIEAAPWACAHVYPRVLEWLAARRALCEVG